MPLFRSVFARCPRWRLVSCGLLAWLAFLPLFAATDPQPVLGPGATKDEVIDAFGWPNGQSRSGTKEILSYNQGNVTLEDGRVERVDFRTNVPWQTPRPRPGPPSATPGKKEPPMDFWLINFEDATKEAARRNARILALFTGPDWSPASRQFRDDAEFHPEFVNAVTGDFVLLRLEYATRTLQAAELREHNVQLRQKYNVTNYPTLLVLAPAGEILAQVDLAKPQPGDSYRARVVAAIREVRDLLGPVPPAMSGSPVRAIARGTNPLPEATPVTGSVTAPAPSTLEELSSKQNALTAPLRSAGWLLTGAAAVGTGVALFLLWLVWKNWTTAKTGPVVSMSSRIAEAASGVPATTEVNSWPRKKLRGIAAALAESEGYAVEVRREGGEIDLAFSRGGDAAGLVLVCCEPGEAGVISAKRLREFSSAMTAENSSAGWFVAPAGFSNDAKTYAEQNGIVLIDGRGLLTYLRDLPPLILPKVLTRQV